MKKSMLVSIHDVTPAFESEVRELWDACREHEIVPALLVVPNWHGEWPLEEHPEFVEWIRRCASAGAEVFLHGERHDEVGSRRSILHHLRAAGRTAREGEFLTLDYAAAGERIDRGLHCLLALGLEPIGFVPPAWLGSRQTYDAVFDANLAISEDAESIRLHSKRRRLRAPAVRWSGRTPVRAHLSVLMERARWKWQHDKPFMRIALHPADLHHPATAGSVRSALRRWSTSHAQVTYASL